VALFELMASVRFETAGEPVRASLFHVERADGSTREQLVCEVVRPGIDFFREQLALVEEWALLREDRASEILCQLTPQFAFWNAVASLHLDARPGTMALLELALGFASLVEMRFKHALACWRPVDLSPSLQPMIATPGHGSLPSGHATEAFFIAHVLESLLPKGQDCAETLHRLAVRTSINRTIAGVHYPADSLAGQMLGRSLGECFVAQCRQHGSSAEARQSWRSHKFDVGERRGREVNFLPSQPPVDGTQASELVRAAKRTVLGWYWDRARAEWGEAT
jgi:hypothetical protein